MPTSPHRAAPCSTGRPVTGVPLTRRRASVHAPIRSSGCACSPRSPRTSRSNAARTIASAADTNISDLIVASGRARHRSGSSPRCCSRWALIAATRRQTAHFRSLVDALDRPRARLRRRTAAATSASRSPTMLGRSEDELLGEGFVQFVHPDDRRSCRSRLRATASRSEMIFRLPNRFGEWRASRGARHRPARTTGSIRGVVLNARDVTERVRLEEELTRQAFHDGLTGLANRALFRDRLDQALARSAAHRATPLAVLLVDLDGFKQVNDSLGHDAGDQLLQQVAERFGDGHARRATRSPGSAATSSRCCSRARTSRWPSTSRGGCSSACPSRSTSPAASSRSARASASSLHRGGAGSSDELIRHADVAMYAAKEAGRGRYEVFQLRDGARARRAARARARAAARPRARRVQPSTTSREVDLDDARRSSASRRSLRWHSPTRGVVPPDRFIPVAEATGLIMPLGEFVLARGVPADGGVAQRRASCPSAFVTWVNLSGKQLVRRRRRRARAADARGRPGSRRAASVSRSPRRRSSSTARRASAPAPSSRSCTTSACASRSTTSAPASRRSASCAASRST